MEKEKNRLKKERKQREAQEQKELNAQGLFRDRQGNVKSFKEVGAQAWHEAPAEEKQARIDIGRCAGKDAWEEAGHGDQEARKQAGRNVWEEVLVSFIFHCLTYPEQLTEADQEAIKEAGDQV